MPVAKVYGLPEMKEEALVELYETILTAIVSVKELNLRESDITVFFPTDMMKKGLGDEIIIFVDGLFEKPERTKKVKDRLAQTIVAFTRFFFSRTGKKANIKEPKLVECFVRSFNPDSPDTGFDSSERKVSTIG